jgi:hypothetical protein
LIDQFLKDMSVNTQAQKQQKKWKRQEVAEAADEAAEVAEEVPNSKYSTILS